MRGTRIGYLSHSLAAERQAHFAAALRAHGEVFEVYPHTWGKLTRAGGWGVANHGDMVNYLLEPAAWQALGKWGPDVLLLQQEAYCNISRQAAAWCREHKVPLVTFSWENRDAPHDEATVAVWNAAALNVFGNLDAQRLAKEAGAEAEAIVLPQVGLDPALFRLDPVDLEHDIGFFGRPGDPMKGEAILDRAAQGQGWRVWKKHQAGFFPYELLASKYRACTVQAVPSLDVPGRPREQFAPAVTIEGLLCGVPVVTTDQAAIAEWTRAGPYIARPCPAAWWAEQGNAESLRAQLNLAILEWVKDPVRFREKGVLGRVWATEHFSNQRVASEYAKALSRAVEVGA